MKHFMLTSAMLWDPTSSLISKRQAKLKGLLMNDFKEVRKMHHEYYCFVVCLFVCLVS